MIALATTAAQAQTTAAPAAAPAPPAATSSMTCPPATVQHTRHYTRRAHSSGDAMTAELNHRMLMHAAESETATITNVTSYNYGHQILPTGAPTVTDLAIYPEP